MEIAKVTSKGQVTVPKAIREQLDLEVGSKIVFLQVGDDLVIRNADSLASIAPSKSDDLKAKFLAEAAAKYDLNVEKIRTESASKSIQQLLEEVRASFQESINEQGLKTDEEILDFFGVDPENILE